MFHLLLFLSYIYTREFTEMGRFIVVDTDNNVFSSDLKFISPINANSQDFVWDLISKSDDAGEHFILGIKEKVLMLDENNTLKMNPVSNYNKIIEKIKKCSSHGTTDEIFCDPKVDLTKELVKDNEDSKEKKKDKKKDDKKENDKKESEGKNDEEEDDEKSDDKKEEEKSKVSYEWVWHISNSSRVVSIRSKSSEKCLKKEGETLIPKGCPALGYNDKNSSFRVYILPTKEKIDEIESLKYNKKIFNLLTSMSNAPEKDSDKSFKKDDSIKIRKHKHIHKHSPIRHVKKLRRSFKKKNNYTDNEDVSSEVSEFDKVIEDEETIEEEEKDAEIEDVSSSSSKLYKNTKKYKKSKKKKDENIDKDNLYKIFKKFVGSGSINSQEKSQGENQANTSNPIDPKKNIDEYQEQSLKSSSPLKRKHKHPKYNGKKELESRSTEEDEEESENANEESKYRSPKRKKRSHVDLDITARGNGKDIKEIVKELTSGSNSKNKNTLSKAGGDLLGSLPQTQGLSTLFKMAGG